MIEPSFINLEHFFAKILDLFSLGWLNINSDFVSFLKIVFQVLALILIPLIIYWATRSYLIWKKMHDDLEKAAEIGEADEVPARPEVNEKWQMVLEHINSENPGDWRLAIIESDTILEEMVERMGYKGENLGERLKQIEKSDFNTLDQAWEAHKTRNRIAHEGSNFKLSRREAMRIISLYEETFREFGYI